MRRNILISLLIALAVLVSCEEKDMKWINAQDPQADSTAITETCEQNNAECGYIKAKADDGKFHKFFCGGCENGYECNSNRCKDIDECADPSLNNCNNKVSTCANEEGTYSCICKENYSGDDCVPDTRTKECENLPENAEWNTASSITQTWNGTSWEPSTVGIYSEEESTYECRFKCKEHYNWNFSLFVCEAETRTADCTGLPENAEWNGSSSLMQTWNGEEWEPASEATFSKTPGKCTFQCSTGFYWNENKCETAPTQTVECTGLPENAHWHSPSSITQTWNGDEWLPSNLGVYSENAGSNECKFECNSKYFWNGSQCVNPCESNPCNSISNSTGICSPSSWEKYSCGCKTNYTWNGSLCTSPCDSHPCSNIANSTGTCILTSKDSYKCECEETYLWRNSKCSKITLGNICTGQDTCYNASSSITCPASPSGTDDEYNFFGQDVQYVNKCTAQSFSSLSDVIVDNNTGLTWAKSPSSSEYTWDNRATPCNNLNGTNYGEKSNWRVPSLLELQTIVDTSRYNPATNSNFGVSARYDLWTDNAFEGNSSYSWSFSPYVGDSYPKYTKTSTLKVLCVSGNKMEKGVFTSQTINNHIIVTDSTTSLMWQKEYATGKSWQQALKYCEDSTYAGYSDWRLPNKNELASLSNYDKSSVPYSYFPGMPSNYFWFWSSSTCIGDLAAAWGVDFELGVYCKDKTNAGNLNVRCVRSDQ